MIINMKNTLVAAQYSVAVWFSENMTNLCCFIVFVCEINYFPDTYVIYKQCLTILMLT